MGERIRPWIEAVRSFFGPLRCENRRRERVGASFYFHSRDLHDGKDSEYIQTADLKELHSVREGVRLNVKAQLIMVK